MQSLYIWPYSCFQIACRRFQRWKGFVRPSLLYHGLGMITAISWPLKTAFYDTFPWWRELLYQYHAINHYKGDDDKSRESRQLSSYQTSLAPSLRPINVDLVVKLSVFYDYSIIPLFPHKLTESNIDLNHYQNSVIITDWTVMSSLEVCWLVSHSPLRILTFFIL